ncbi:hypothetical protein N658DRAFT_492790 [Parathielavia hyrcaniae]|uniref:Secreted protein n=1 Tax=Parathielavia hyrcaniae TaxID=113614 RepID=A0AAN6T582_9PEZI|nr:hypothetical protein N658DRAFT_492790 [Parathielavia hyrcaniae]
MWPCLLLVILARGVSSCCAYVRCVVLYCTSTSARLPWFLVFVVVPLHGTESFRGVGRPSTLVLLVGGGFCRAGL